MSDTVRIEQVDAVAALERAMTAELLLRAPRLFVTGEQGGHVPADVDHIAHLAAWPLRPIGPLDDRYLFALLSASPDPLDVSGELSAGDADVEGEPARHSEPSPTPPGVDGDNARCDAGPVFRDKGAGPASFSPEDGRMELIHRIELLGALLEFVIGSGPSLWRGYLRGHLRRAPSANGVHELTAEQLEAVVAGAPTLAQTLAQRKGDPQ